MSSRSNLLARRLMAILIFLLCFGTLTSGGQGATAARESFLQERPFVSSLGSDSGWVLHNLRRHGYSFRAQFVEDLSAVVPDPPSASRGLGRYSLDLFLNVDGEKAIGWKGATGLARFKHHQAEFGDSYDLSAQVYSNIDAPTRASVYELWLQQSLLGDKLRLKFGKIDVNTEFAAVPTASDFLNTSMGFSPTIVAFPTYPQPKLGFMGFLQPNRHYSAGLGVFGTSGKGTMTLAEPQLSWWAGNEELHGHASFGYWRLDGDLPGIGEVELQSTQGFYTVLEQDALRQALAKAAAERRISFFLQFGSAEGKASPITQHLGTGAVLQALLPSRPRDTLGLGVTWARFSHTSGTAFDYDGELVAEVYYKIPLNQHFALLQNFQFLHQPGGVRTRPDCVVITPRLTFSF